MNVILQQLGDLALGSVPTMIIFLILVLAYRFLVFGPLSRTLVARYERTQGAVEKAALAIAAADAKAQEYEAKLRAARVEIFHHRDQRIQQWNKEREIALASVRLAAQERVRVAKTALEAQTSEARQQIEGSTEQLATQILQVILPAGMAPAESAH